MSKSVGIVLTATAISFGNEFIQTDTLNFRIPLAGGLVALLFDGIEKINEEAAVGLSIMMFLTVLLTPFNGTSPAQMLGDIATGLNATDRKIPKANLNPSHALRLPH
jgi:hypothetical protein